MPSAITALISYPLWLFHNSKSIFLSVFRYRKNESQLLNAICDAVIIVLPDGRIKHMNSRAEAIAEQLQADSVDFLFSDIFAQGIDAEKFPLIQAIQQCEKTQDIVHCKKLTTLTGRLSKKTIVTAILQPVFDNNHLLESIIIGITDVTESTRTLQNLAFQATHNTLTQLPNRALLLERLEMAIYRANRIQKKVAILAIDLDRFKNVNDGLGHNLGDLVLKGGCTPISTIYSQREYIGTFRSR